MMNAKQVKKQEHESAASLRVNLCNPPELTSLHRKAICDFEVAYTDYEEKVKAQGSKNTKPLLKALCVTRIQREVIAMARGIKFSDLSNEIILTYMEEVKQEQYMGLQLDERNIFKGINMRVPEEANDIGAVVADFYVDVNDRMRESGLASRFLHDGDSKELRKQCFPLLMKGVWPREAYNYLKKKWEGEGKKWMIMELLKEVKLCATKYGPYELTKTEGKRDSSRSSGYEQKSKWVSYKGGMKDSTRQGDQWNKPKERKDWKGAKKIDHRPPVKAGQDSKRWMSGGGTQKIVCFKCGQPGHKKPDCKLSDDNFKVVAYKKKYQEARQGMRKLGINIMVDEQDTDEEVKGSDDIEQENLVQDQDSEYEYSDVESN